MVKRGNIIGVDLGGTKVRAGRVNRTEIEKSEYKLISANGSETEILEEIFWVIDRVKDENSMAIGIGVPSIVDIDEGVVYDVQNIPSWKEVHLRKILEQKFSIPVFLNNDANCFTLGEYYYGKAKKVSNFVGLIIGTGIAAGIIVDNQIYNGANCGAGEFGMVPYLDSHIEYYCSGQFFENMFGITGSVLFEKAEKGDVEAREIYYQFGYHLSTALKVILYSVDPEQIVFGGSVSKAYKYFKNAMLEGLEDFAYPSVIENLMIHVSSNPDIPVLGAASLYYNSNES